MDKNVSSLFAEMDAVCSYESGAVLFTVKTCSRCL